MPGVPPDAFDQLKRVFKGMFRRNTKKPITIRQSEQPHSASLGPETKQTPQPALSAQEPEAAATPSTRPNLSSSSVSDSHGPSPITEGAPASAQDSSVSSDHAVRPGTAGTNASAPRELSSGPRSPVKPVAPLVQHPADDASTEENYPVEPSSGTGLKNDSKAESSHSNDSAVEQDPSHHKAFIEDLAHQNEPIAEQKSISHAKSLAEQAEHAEHAEEHAEERAEEHAEHAEHAEYAEPRPDFSGPSSVEIHDTESQTTPSELLPKSAPVAVPMDPSTTTPAPHEEMHQANEAARRAPAVFHDEKIPVMAEPPEVPRSRPAAPGMVATSGPLEDFPFR